MANSYGQTELVKDCNHEVYNISFQEIDSSLCLTLILFYLDSLQKIELHIFIHYLYAFILFNFGIDV